MRESIVIVGMKLSDAGINWLDIDVMSDEGINWAQHQMICLTSGINWSDIDVMSDMGINWGDIDVMSDAGTKLEQILNAK